MKFSSPAALIAVLFALLVMPAGAADAACAASPVPIAAGAELAPSPQDDGAPDDPPRPRRIRSRYVQEKQEEPEEEEKKDEEEDGKKEDDVYLALIGGDVYTVTGPVLRDTTVLVKNGKIADLGRDLELPEGTEVMDVSGLRVYPGLVAVSSSRLLGSEPPEHTTDVYDLNMILGLSGGLTTVVTGNTAAKLTFGTIDGMILKRNIFTSLRYTRSSPIQRRELREDLERVRQYLRDLAEYSFKKSMGDKEAKEPDKKWIKSKYATYLSLLKGEVTALMSADTTQDLRDAAELAAHFGFRLVIRGGIEAWTMAPELGRAGVSMIITPRRKTAGRRRYGEESEDASALAKELGIEFLGATAGGNTPAHVEDPDEKHEGDEEAETDTAAWGDDRLMRPTGWKIELARILYDSGVHFAVIPSSPVISLGGITGRDLLMMPMEAAFAVRGGLPEQAALESITIGAARILGVDDRVGSIEIGKDADLIVCDGDLLHYKTMVQWAVVNGKVAYDKEKESLFAHIRPRGKEGTEAKPEFWPRDFGPMPSFEPEVEPPAPGEEPPAPEKEPEESGLEGEGDGVR
jgi:hypothetical protein